MQLLPQLRISAILVLLVSVAVMAQAPSSTQSTGPSSEPITVTVTAIGHGESAPPAIPIRDVIVHQNNKVRHIVSWEPVSPSDPKLDIVVVIDDALANSLATRYDELRSFFAALPAGARVAVAYANRGSIQLAQQTTTDHTLAVKALRNPSGVQIDNDSPYESIEELARGWPARQGRRVMVFISSGVDIHSSGEGQNPEDWETMHKAVDAAQTKGIVIYSIFAKPFMSSSITEFMLSKGQDGLNYLSTQTGGKAFYAGLASDPDFDPYFREIQEDLQQQYTLTFQAEPGKKAGFDELHVSLETKSPQLRYPARVFVPSAK
jgi:VWFA-related protein